MQILLLLGLMFGLLNTGEPDYLVHIVTESPRDALTVFQDWGSGSLVDPEYVLTCNHNIEAIHSSITVRFKNGDEVKAEVFKRVPLFDLALLKLSKVRYEKPVKLSEQTSVKAGQTVTVWGFPGDGDAEAQSITGEVFPSILIMGGVRRSAFRFDGQAGRGVSGGPVLIGGKLVGVEFATFPITGVRCINTPQVRDLLRQIP